VYGKPSSFREKEEALHDGFHACSFFLTPRIACCETTEAISVPGLINAIRQPDFHSPLSGMRNEEVPLVPIGRHGCGV
jgi:hypothetical protein